MVDFVRFECGEVLLAMRIDDGFVLGKYIFCKFIKYINIWLDIHRKRWTLLDLNVG